MFQDPKHQKKSFENMNFYFWNDLQFFKLSFLASCQIWLGPLLNGYLTTNFTKVRKTRPLGMEKKNSKNNLR
jgi:hypothetical protein